MLIGAFLLGILVVNVVGLGYLYASHRKMAFAFKRIATFVNPRGEDPSELAEVVDLLAARVLLRLKTAAMGEASGDAKARRSAEEGMTRDLVTQVNPMVAMGLDAMMPKWARYFAANPALMGKALEMVQKYGGATKTEEPAAPEVNGNQQIPLEL